MGKPRTDEPDISLGAQGRKRIGNDGIDVAAGTAGGRAWVAESPVHLECRHVKSVDLPNWGDEDRYVVVFGEVIGIHIKDDLITEEGLVDVGRMRPLGRLGYNDYTEVDSNTIFTMVRPD